MAEKNIEQVSIAGASSLPLFRLALNTAKNKWYDLNEGELKQMQLIQMAYSAFCSLENEHPVLNTLQITSTDADKNDSNLPIFFQLDNERSKRPLIGAKNFEPNMNTEDWKKHLQAGDLHTIVNDLIIHICNFQAKRINILFSQFNYIYEPVNLFFAEIKHWLVKLTHTIIDDKAKQIVDGRILYINHLI